MNKINFAQEQLARVAKLSDEDVVLIKACRGAHNRLGLAYQLCYVKLFNRFPAQSPFVPVEELATFVAVQLDIPVEQLLAYASQQVTFSHHQDTIQEYLQVEKFGQATRGVLKDYLLQQAQQIQATEPLLIRATEFLKEKKILNPSDYTVERLIQTQREKARTSIFERVSATLTPDVRQSLDDLLVVDDQAYSKLYQIKDVPRKSSVAAMKLLADKLSLIEQTGALMIDLSWLNNNYKRYLSSYVTRCDAKRLRELAPANRYTSLTCFLQEAYQDTTDHIFDMYQKTINALYTQADITIETYNRSKQRVTRSCLSSHKKLCIELLAVAAGTTDIATLLKEYPAEKLQTRIDELEILLTGRYSHDLNIVADRFSYLRQMARPLLEKLTLELAPTGNNSLLDAIQIVRELTQGARRTVPEDTNLDFLPKTTAAAIKEGGKINLKRYEVAVFTAARDNVKCGNVAIRGSKRFGKLDDFFIPMEQWAVLREAFFLKARLPVNAQEVPRYLEARLQKAFDHFLSQEKGNTFASVSESGWVLSKDPAEEFSETKKQQLARLNQWLGEHMRTIKLPDLLIEVDNELHFTNTFLPAARRHDRSSEDVCSIITSLMAYGCNIGPHLMSQMISGISYKQIKHVFDWQITDDAQRQALAQVVNGIAGIEITKVWGSGKTSGSDAQRFGYHNKTLHRTFSHKLNDFALEFYTFVADNFAPFYNLVKEATDRDSSKVLDGHLYNVSDLEIEEHYTDTHGYDEVNFAAFAMLGKSFSPRIKNIKSQWLYKIDQDKDYGSLNALLKGANHTSKLGYVVDQWDRIGQFYASLAAGQVTASTALKRLTSFTEKNTFYRANLELGRVLKTEHILLWMSDPARRKRTRRGLLKVEQIHQLARDITYGNHGRLKGRSLEEVNSSGNCTTLIMAAIIYWQAREISKVIQEHDPEEAGIDVSLLAHVSPIGWSNVIIYGEYRLDRGLVK
jgi:TnpA family transposase